MPLLPSSSRSYFDCPHGLQSMHHIWYPDLHWMHDRILLLRIRHCSYLHCVLDWMRYLHFRWMLPMQIRLLPNRNILRCLRVELRLMLVSHFLLNLRNWILPYHYWNWHNPNLSLLRLPARMLYLRVPWVDLQRMFDDNYWIHILRELEPRMRSVE